MYDVAVLGSGVAGLSCAIHAAGAGAAVVLVTKGRLSTSATRYAQGGVAAALAAGDSPELHAADTLAAGAGLCDPEAVEVLVREGPQRVRELESLGATFDRIGGALAFAREGGHSLARVVHAGGDATGAEIERALAAGLPAGIEVREGWFSFDLLIRSGRCAGASVGPPGGDVVALEARHTVLATGGAGQLYSVTTNPAVSTGDGIAMAWRAGAAIADVEFMQFHPTALHHPTMPRPLLSEALRGDGAVLRDERGRAFMGDEHPMGDLAPRDVVARAITRRLIERGLDHLWLDATAIDDLSRRFPTIWAAARAAGYDPTTDWLPVAPAAHYLSGGVCTDLDGATTLPGLWACGEVACSGVHGANRLASNSLLDGLVFAPRVAAAITAGKDGPDPTGVLRDVAPLGGRPAPGPGPAATLGREELQRLMTTRAGVLRDRGSLDAAWAALGGDDPELTPTPTDPAAAELANLTQVGRLLVSAARAREESRGTHTRLDFPEPDDAWRGRIVHRRGLPARFAPLREAVPAGPPGVGATTGDPLVAGEGRP
jgi:L-aspartate oxidase